MPDYIVELVDGFYHFYLEVDAEDTDGNPVTIKDLKFKKTIAKVTAEIAIMDANIVEAQEEADAEIAMINVQKAKKQAILDLMV